MDITAHIVVPDAAIASDRYMRAFGAAEESRVPMPGGSAAGRNRRR